MDKRLPVERSLSPYRYVCENMEVLEAEFYRVAEAGRQRGGKRAMVGDLQRILDLIETLGAVKAAFESNGWCE